MDFSQLVQTRKSIRGYAPDRVPRELIDEIIRVGKGAPSSMNTQPWQVYVVSGTPLKCIQTEMVERMAGGMEPRRDFRAKEDYDGVYRDRQVNIAIDLFSAMGIVREDKQQRHDWLMRGFRQFDAPVSIVLAYEKCLEPAALSQFDLGALCYGICLAAWERGLGTVINGQGVMQSDIVRKHANIPDDQNVMICIAMGYPDPDFPANNIKSHRISNEDFVSFVGFEECAG